MRLLHGSNIEIVKPDLVIFEDLMADLAAYLVSEYDIDPRDATGLVMNSPLTQQLYSSEEPITEQRVRVLAEEMLASFSLT